MVSRPKQNNSHKNTDGRSPSSSNTSVNIPASAWKILVILSCLATMVMYAETMLIPAIPDLIKDFHVSYSMSSWILTAYLITGAVMTPIAGKLSDIYGKKRILLIIMVIYAIGVSIAGFATNIYFLLFARAIQGIGMAMFPIAFSIIRDNFPREKLSIGQGVISSMFASGAVIGLSVGGAIIKHFGWQATFFTIIPIAIGLLIVVSRFIRVNEEQEVEKEGQPEELQQGHMFVETEEKRFESKDNKETNNNRGSKAKHRSVVDIKGAITLAATVTSFLLVLTYMETGDSGGTSAGSLQPIIFLVIGIISLALFILVEKRSTNPLVDFRLLLHKTVLPANLIIMIVGFSMFMVFQTIPILARNPPPLGFGEDAVSTWQLTIAICCYTLGIWTDIWFYYIQARINEASHSWCIHYFSWILRPANVSFNPHIIISKPCNSFYRFIINKCRSNECNHTLYAKAVHGNITRYEHALENYRSGCRSRTCRNVYAV